MILGPKKLLQLVKENKLVENLDSRELNNPEGAGFDIRLGAVYKISGKGFLGIDERKTPKESLVTEYNSKKRQSFVFKSGKYHLIKTLEHVNLPIDISAHIYPRSTLFRSGLLFLCTHVSPGYTGELVFGLVNLSKSPVEIELGARVAFIQFSQVFGGGTPYRGQWQGGRVSAGRREKQV